jgi:hypothetical protein
LTKKRPPRPGVAFCSLPMSPHWGDTASGLTSGLAVAIASFARSSLHYRSADRPHGHAPFRRGRRQSTSKTPNSLCSRTMQPPGCVGFVCSVPRNPHVVHPLSIAKSRDNFMKRTREKKVVAAGRYFGRRMSARMSGVTVLTSGHHDSSSSAAAATAASASRATAARRSESRTTSGTKRSCSSVMLW